MASKYLIGLDIGTSGAKCILVDDKGAVLASSTQEYPLSTPKPGWAEQDPQDWWDAVSYTHLRLLGTQKQAWLTANRKEETQYEKDHQQTGEFCR